MSLYLLLCCLLYVFFSVCLLKGWTRIAVTTTEPLMQADVTVAVIIPIRNEKEHIELILQDLLNQSYPKHLLTIYLADDGSSDGTQPILQTWVENYPDRFKPVILFPEYTAWKGKKKMIASAIAQSTETLLLTTDADCRVSSLWVGSMVDSYIKTKASFISGPVRILGKTTYWNNFQSIEFLSLVGSGASAIGLKLSVMCNGANVAYTRAAYNQVNGFEGNEAIASGDDEFLMHKITSEYSAHSVVFCKNAGAIVTTSPAVSWKQFYNQRKRWAGKWEHYKLWYVQVIAVWVFIFHFTLLIASGLALFNLLDFRLTLLMWVIKAIFDYFYLKSIARFLSIDFKKSTFINAVLIYPFYVVLFGIASRFGSYNWKERTETIS